MDDKYIFIVISQTGTILSRLLKLITKADYNHASLSVDSTLNEMYSFGRIHPYNPFLGGYVRESKNYGTFKRFKNTKVIVLRIPICDIEYNSIKSKLETMYNHRKLYSYNYPGIILAWAGICFKHDNWYYCSEFVRDILIEYNIIHGSNREIVHPSDMLSLESTSIVYMGLLQNYNI